MEAYDGVVIHFVSNRYVLPEDPFNLDMIWWFLHDYNQEPSRRHSRLLNDIKYPDRDYASYHNLIGRDGENWELVHQRYQAYHAGVSSYDGRNRCNRFMLGLGLVNKEDVDFTNDQYHEAAAQCGDWIKEHGFESEAIVGHDKVSPGRKHDPGPLFDWGRFHRLLAARLRLT